MTRRRWKCCPCCEPGEVAFDDHQAVTDGGSFIEKDGHDGPCPVHQDSIDYAEDDQ